MHQGLQIDFSKIPDTKRFNFFNLLPSRTQTNVVNYQYNSTFENSKKKRNTIEKLATGDYVNVHSHKWVEAIHSILEYYLMPIQW